MIRGAVSRGIVAEIPDLNDSQLVSMGIKQLTVVA